jgi:hypothetical protein
MTGFGQRARWPQRGRPRPELHRADGRAARHRPGRRQAGAAAEPGGRLRRRRAVPGLRRAGRAVRAPALGPRPGGGRGDGRRRRLAGLDLLRPAGRRAWGARAAATCSTAARRSTTATRRPTAAGSAWPRWSPSSLPSWRGCSAWIRPLRAAPVRPPLWPRCARPSPRPSAAHPRDSGAAARGQRRLLRAGARARRGAAAPPMRRPAAPSSASTAWCSRRPAPRFDRSRPAAAAAGAGRGRAHLHRAGRGRLRAAAIDARWQALRAAAGEPADERPATAARRRTTPADARRGLAAAAARRRRPGLEVLMLRRAERDGDLRSGACVFPAACSTRATAAHRPVPAPTTRRQQRGWAARRRPGLRRGGGARDLRGGRPAAGLRRPGQRGAVAAAAAAWPWRERLQPARPRWPSSAPPLGLRWTCAGLAYFSHWLTPPGVPKRFDTRFFMRGAPAGQEARPTWARRWS